MQRKIIYFTLLPVLLFVAGFFQESYASGAIANGTYDDVPWIIEDVSTAFWEPTKYELIIGKYNKSTQFKYKERRQKKDYPWNSPEYSNLIEAVSFVGNVKGNGSHDYMFESLYKVESIDLTNFDSANITSVGGMFSGCEKLKALDISSLELNSGIEMANLFSGCKSLQAIRLGSKTLLSENTPYNDWRRYTDLNMKKKNTPVIHKLSTFNGKYTGWYISCAIPEKVKIKKIKTYAVKGGNTQLVIKIKTDIDKRDTYRNKPRLTRCYEVQISEKKSFKNNATTKLFIDNKRSFEKRELGAFGGLEKGKTYYVRVRGTVGVMDRVDNTTTFWERWWEDQLGLDDDEFDYEDYDIEPYYTGPWSNIKKIKGK